MDCNEAHPNFDAYCVGEHPDLIGDSLIEFDESDQKWHRRGWSGVEGVVTTFDEVLDW